MNRKHLAMSRRFLLRRGLHVTGLALAAFLVNAEMRQANAKTTRALRTKRPVHARPVGGDVASGGNHSPEEWLKPDNGDGGRGKDDGYRPVI